MRIFCEWCLAETDHEILKHTQGWVRPHYPTSRGMDIRVVSEVGDIEIEHITVPIKWVSCNVCGHEHYN